VRLRNNAVCADGVPGDCADGAFDNITIALKITRPLHKQEPRRLVYLLRRSPADGTPAVAESALICAVVEKIPEPLKNPHLVGHLANAVVP